MPPFWRRVFIFILSCLPLAWLVWATLQQQLGADPAKTIVLETGHYAFYFLLLTLAVTPLRRLVKFPKFHFRWLQTHRRMLGLFTLFYALTHVAAYLVFILGMNLSLFAEELVKRPYILFTMPALALLIVLGITSTQGMMRRLGKNWRRLHNSIYIIAVLAWLHVFLQVRSSYQDAVLFGFAVAFLLGIRLYWKWSNKRPPARATSS